MHQPREVQESNAHGGSYTSPNVLRSPLFLPRGPNVGAPTKDPEALQYRRVHTVRMPDFRSMYPRRYRSAAHGCRRSGGDARSRLYRQSPIPGAASAEGRSDRSDDRRDPARRRELPMGPGSNTRSAAPWAPAAQDSQSVRGRTAAAPQRRVRRPTASYSKRSDRTYFGEAIPRQKRLGRRS